MLDSSLSNFRFWKCLWSSRYALFWVSACIFSFVFPIFGQASVILAVMEYMRVTTQISILLMLQTNGIFSGRMTAPLSSTRTKSWIKQRGRFFLPRETTQGIFLTPERRKSFLNASEEDTFLILLKEQFLWSFIGGAQIIFIH